jgi:hypothetical protein
MIVFFIVYFYSTKRHIKVFEDILNDYESILNNNGLSKVNQVNQITTAYRNTAIIYAVFHKNFDKASEEKFVSRNVLP